MRSRSAAAGLLLSVVLPITTNCRQGPKVALNAESVIRLDSLVHPPEAVAGVAEVAVTNKSVIVSFASCEPEKLFVAGRCSFHLVSFDRRTGKVRKSLQTESPTRYSYPAHLIGATSKTFLALQDNEVTEYDDKLIRKNRIRFPAEMSLSPRPPGFAYGWAETLKSSCPLKDTVAYDLSEKRKLILACGSEAGVADEHWQPLFVENYCGRVNMISPYFSEDGTRVVLKYQRNHPETGHTVIMYTLYDLRGSAFQRSAFDLGNETGEYTALSADGTVFAAAGLDRTSSVGGAAWVLIYRLPDHLAMRRHRSIAKVAMGRRLAVRLYWMWRNGSAYSPSFEFGSYVGQPGTGHGVN
jgi:hypothetical protein